VRNFGICDSVLDSGVVQKVEEILDGGWQRVVDVKNRLEDVVNVLL